MRGNARIRSNGVDRPIPDSRQAETAQRSKPFTRRWSSARLFAQCNDPVLQRPQTNPEYLGRAFAIAAYVIEDEFV